MKAKIYIGYMISGLRLAAMSIMAIVLCSLPISCDHSELWDEVPGEISEFINQYYPNSELVSVSHNGNNYHIRIDNGPGLSFDSDYRWVDINGYGMPLPQVLLFDQLPPRLYDYLQETEQLNAVFSMSRDGDKYSLTLLSSTLRFDASTGKLTGSGFSGSALKSQGVESSIA